MEKLRLVRRFSPRVEVWRVCEIRSQVWRCISHSARRLVYDHARLSASMTPERK